MRLYFLRHADALDGADDAARPLSSKGRDQARRVGQFLLKQGIGFDAAYSSPLVRARETAELVLRVCGAVGPEELRLDAALGFETTARQFEGWLRCLPEARHVLLVGHAPSLPEHVRRLVGIADEGGFRMPKGALVCVDSEDGRSGLLKFFVSPKLLERFV
jgi:phosphohistidine phosphatase